MQVAVRMSMDCMEAVNMDYMVRVRSMVMDVDMDLGLGMGRHMDLDMVVAALDKYPRGDHWIDMIRDVWFSNLGLVPVRQAFVVALDGMVFAAVVANTKGTVD